MRLHSEQMRLLRTPDWITALRRVRQRQGMSSPKRLALHCAARCLCHRSQRFPVMSQVGDLVGHDQVVFGIDGDLHVVAARTDSFVAATTFDVIRGDS